MMDDSATPNISLSQPVPVPSATEADTKTASTVEIPILRIVSSILIGGLLSGAGFMGYRLWKAHLRPKPRIAVKRPAPASVLSTRSARTDKPVKRITPKPVAHVPNAASSHHVSQSRSSEPEPQAEEAHSSSHSSPPASYDVVPLPTPQKQRHAAPLDSVYAQKRRADKSLWSQQEEQAIRQAQRHRLYGGQRTVQRNVEILMQILRDREYNTAFETGKRIHLYNDVDWDASHLEGPLYNVRLTFSGGKETDGSPRKPLRFAFEVDLERNSVAPAGTEGLRANTMHAFFDESRIAPEARRSIAKDTEELVLAAQPEASPLALDTVVRQFAATYTAAALQRVADAYQLNLVARKLIHDPKLSTSAPAEKPKTTEKSVESSKPVFEKTTKTAAVSGKPHDVEYQVEKGPGGERTILARVSSRASASRLWEALTGYDQLKQFVPDVLVSEREGRDGNAIIVHTVSLSRFLFFVFKVNLHLRIIESPTQRSLEFERIAGDFEQFRGSVQLEPEKPGEPARLIFKATIKPKGRTPLWALRDMSRGFIAPVLQAICARAELS